MITNTPSKYWVELSNDGKELIKLWGYDHFKQTVSVLLYNDFGFNKIKGTISDNYNSYLRQLWDYLYKALPNKILDKLEEPMEGDPMVIEYKGRNVSFDLATSALEYNTMSTYIDFTKINSINEIGAGYGKTAYVILTLHPHIKYHIFDIEPSINIAGRYLPSVLPNADIEFSLPDGLADEKCDLFIGINCIHEMTMNQIQSYFDYADKNAQYFYMTCWFKTVVPGENLSLSIWDYPVKPSWKVLHVDAFLQFKFFEALFKCQK